MVFVKKDALTYLGRNGFSRTFYENLLDIMTLKRDEYDSVVRYFETKAYNPRSVVEKLEQYLSNTLKKKETTNKVIPFIKPEKRKSDKIGRLDNYKISDEKQLIEMAKTGDDSAKEELFKRHQYIIVQRAKANMHSDNEFEELLSSGNLGFVDGLNKFRLDKNVALRTYLYRRIDGQIKDYLRSMAAEKGRNRKFLKNRRKLYGLIDEYEDVHSCSPNEEYICEKLGWSREELIETMRIEKNIHFSLNETFQTESGEIERGSMIEDIGYDPENKLDIVLIREYLRHVIGQLDEKRSIVIQLHYGEDLTLKEISKIMNLSEARISQLHTEALEQIRNYSMTDEENHLKKAA